MTEASTLGSMDSAPLLKGKADGGAWTLWERLAPGRPEFGLPSVFADQVDESKWISFTTTQHDPTFFRIVRDATGNVAGEGGLITFVDSGVAGLDRAATSAAFHWSTRRCRSLLGLWPACRQAWRPREEADVGLHRPGNHDRDSGPPPDRGRVGEILENLDCIPCMMPFITSQFLPRQRGDRPPVVPHGSDQSRPCRPVLRAS